jgi:hypothetical protein
MQSALNASIVTGKGKYSDLNSNGAQTKSSAGSTARHVMREDRMITSLCSLKPTQIRGNHYMSTDAAQGSKIETVQLSPNRFSSCSTSTGN